MSSSDRKPGFQASTLRPPEGQEGLDSRSIDKDRVPSVPCPMSRSMTGFGRGQSEVEGALVTVELRSVNHKFLDVRVQAGGPLATYSGSIERRLRKSFLRGRLEASLTLVRAPGAQGAAVLDVERAREVAAALRELRTMLELSGEVSLALVAGAPGVMTARTEVEAAVPTLDRAVEDALDGACSSLLEMRTTEGGLLKARLDEHLETVRRHVEVLQTRSRLSISEKQRRLEERVKALLVEVDVPEDRMAQELALLVDRLDVSEEIERLEAHLSHAGSILHGEGPMGRKLDFLVQEMNRESNTIGSKCADAAMAHEVVELKAEVERMREQIQNLE